MFFLIEENESQDTVLQEVRQKVWLRLQYDANAQYTGCQGRGTMYGKILLRLGAL